MAGSVYWQGANGDTYLKGASGVQDLGTNNTSFGTGGFESGKLGQSIQAQRINDPNPPSAAAPAYPTISIPGPYVPPQPATINVGSILAGAKSNATNQVNPLYDKYLNQYLQNEAAGKAAQQAQTDAIIKNTQAQLANQLKGTGLERQATQQNTDLDLANIGAQEQNYQAQSGFAFNQQREQQLAQQGQAGLAGSGLAQGADQASQQGRNLKEAGQEQGYTYSANQKKLLEGQTFDQLANSDDLSRLKETEGENTANFNLADYLRQASNSEFQFQKQNEIDRQNAIQQATANIYKTNFLSALQPYAGTPTYAATYQAYGGGAT